VNVGLHPRNGTGAEILLIRVSGVVAGHTRHNGVVTAIGDRPMVGLEGVKLCSTRSDVISEESVGVALSIGEDIIDIDSLELAVDGMAGRHIVLLFEWCKLKNLVLAGDMMAFMLDDYVAFAFRFIFHHQA
jgi:hypothetical protein